jgi:hypothetical protein
MLLKSDSEAQQTHLWSWCVDQRLMLSSSFSSVQIYENKRYDFGHTLLYYLSRTQMFNKTTPEASLLIKGSCLAPALGMNKSIIVKEIIFVTLCYAT